jgi:hypothetical protein
MINPDEQIQKLLRQWEAPAPDPRLDDRVWNSFRQAAASERNPWPRKWLPIAAGILLSAGLAKHLMTPPSRPAASRSISINTTADAAGFTAVPDGSITVVKEERKQ